jgi:CRP-like cAMP-binding protein
MQEHAKVAGACPVGQRSKAPGITAGVDLGAFRDLMKVRGGIDRGQTIVGSTGLSKHFAVLLKGVACFSTRHEDGRRQIHAFHYPGDFLGLHSFLFPLSVEATEVQALSSCSVGTIDRDVLDHQIQRNPALGAALWQAAMTEASILRQRLLVTRRPALQRVGHLLCEQLARLGIEEGVIPFSQIDVADAAGLSTVHTNRIFQDLRKLGALSDQRLIEVVDKKRLRKLAAFDGRYLDLSETLSRWHLRVENQE